MSSTPCDHCQDADNFVSGIEPRPGPRGAAYWFIFQGEKMLYRPADGRAETPLASEVHTLGVNPVRSLYLGYLEQPGADATDCYAAELAADDPLPPGMLSDGLRGLHPLLDEAQFAVAGRAIQLLAWDRTHQFCGQCGTPTLTEPHERAKRCPACGLVSYPRLSPAIIIAVVRKTAAGSRLLMARNHRFPPGRYSVIAGYVEPGETLEECAHREVCEEVGIAIRNMRYFGSQPWPFPNSLMIAFTAEYAGGEIRLEEAEIADAGWFAADALPGLPPRISVARRLIDWFAETHPAQEATPV